MGSIGRIIAACACAAVAGCAAKAPEDAFVPLPPPPVYECRRLERPSIALPVPAPFILREWTPRVMTRPRSAAAWERIAGEGIGAVAYMSMEEFAGAMFDIHRAMAIIRQYRARAEAFAEWSAGAEPRREDPLSGLRGRGFDASDPPAGVGVVQPERKARVVLYDCPPRDLPNLRLPKPDSFAASPWTFRIMTRDGAESEWEGAGADAIVHMPPREASNMALDFRDIAVRIHILRIGDEAIERGFGPAAASP